MISMNDNKLIELIEKYIKSLNKNLLSNFDELKKKEEKELFANEL